MQQAERMTEQLNSIQKSSLADSKRLSPIAHMVAPSLHSRS